MRSLEERLDLKHNVLIELIRQQISSSKTRDKEKQTVIDEELPSSPRMNSKSRVAIEVPFRRSSADPMGKKEQNSARGPWPNPNQGTGTNLPLPKNPKVIYLCSMGKKMF